MLKKFEPGKYHASPSLPRWFQKRLTRLAGRNPYGLPMLRIIWGMDCFWTRAEMKVPQYPGSYNVIRDETISPGGLPVIEETTEYFGTPRFVIEQWFSLEQIMPGGEEAWNALRFDYAVVMKMVNGVRLPVVEKFDWLGECPVEGQYRAITVLRTSDGGYMEPNAQIMELIEEGWKRRGERKPGDLKQEIRDMWDQIIKRRKKVIDNLDDAIEDSLKLHGHRIVDPHRVGKGGSENPSRVIMPGSQRIKPAGKVALYDR